MSIVPMARRLAALIAGLARAAGAQAQWQPSKPITIIVPWSAGGATHPVARRAAREHGKARGPKGVIGKQPRA
jgi:tripartite-type tricarboxylate transporter receptor subunit TctC